MRHLALIPLLLLAIGFALAGEPKYVKARISFFSNAKDEFYPKPKSLLLTDLKEVEKLMACFPGLGGKKLPMKPAGWKARITIVFMPKKGAGTIVYLNRSLDLWSNLGAYGDGKTKPEIKPIVADAEKRAKTLD